MVSHDSGFLDAVCSSIIHYEDNFKLKKYLVRSRERWCYWWGWAESVWAVGGEHSLNRLEK